MEDEAGGKNEVDVERPLPFTIDPDSLEVMLTKYRSYGENSNL